MESFQAVAIENVVLESIGMMTSCIGSSLSLSTASATIPGPNYDLMWNHQRDHSLPNIHRPGVARRPCCQNQVGGLVFVAHENHCANELGRWNSCDRRDVE